MKPVGENEWKKFVDDGLVYNTRLRIIAIKITKAITLSLKEKAIFESKTKEINEIIIRIKQSKQP